MLCFVFVAVGDGVGGVYLDCLIGGQKNVSTKRDTDAQHGKRI